MENTDLKADLILKHREWEGLRHAEQKARKELIDLAKKLGSPISFGKYANVKLEYENEPRVIPATAIRKDRGRRLVFDGETQVGEFSESKVESWSLEEFGAAKAGCD